MRLLNRKTIELQEYFDSRIPPYAIFSHRWENDEVSYQDLLAARTGKRGYAKIKGCCDAIATYTGSLEWVWIDTCCIDKRSSAELSEAINSMFRWYQKADICYAYLSDVPYSRRWLSFRRSNWFTRGWTLQELLAPPAVRFFDDQWHVIGEKTNLASEIETITKIPVKALLKNFEGPGNLDSFSIAERMSWAAARDTSRAEDIAYCLMGIFDINMPLLYGEGVKAFWRLQEEIMKVSVDETIFAWNLADRELGTEQTSLLAPHPSCFARSSDVVAAWTQWQNGFHETRLPYMMRNRGLQISARLWRFPNQHEMVLVLNCHRTSHRWRPLVLRLLQLGQDYHRLSCEELTTDQEEYLCGSEQPSINTLHISRKQLMLQPGREHETGY